MVLIIFSMTADVQAMIHNDQPSSRGRRIPMSRQDRELYQLHMQNFPKPQAGVSSITSASSEPIFELLDTS